jgi:hypothetical protein
MKSRFKAIGNWQSFVLPLLVLLSVCGFSNAAELKTENVVLITSDGLRWQEVFTGAEKELLSKEVGGVANVKGTENKFWRETPEERRQAMMPFFWSEIASKGQIFGNQHEGSVAQITNAMRFSYPGYNEILTGFADPNIDSNDKRPNDNVTVFEWLHNKPEFTNRVAAFSSWDVIPFVFNQRRCGFPVMGGWEPVPEPHPNAKQELLNDLIATTYRQFPPELYDSFVFHAAFEHLLAHKPRLLFVSFLETDAWGHAGRYDQLLQSANNVDTFVRKLWDTMQSMDEYKDKTTFIMTTDHGRGSGPVNWKTHGKTMEGAENIWMAFLGPDTPPLGERENCDKVTQSQVAATLAAFLGQDYHGDVTKSGAPIKDVLPKATAE